MGAYEAKTHLPELLEAGEEITITKHGAPVAKLVPIKKEASAEERVAAIRRIQTLGPGFNKVLDLQSAARAADEPSVRR